MKRVLPAAYLILAALLPSGNHAAQPASSTVVDASTMDGKVMCGYQGWFDAPGDGSGRGWVHWGAGAMRPGSATVEMWPEMSEYGPGDSYPTGFRNADGTPATLFSSYNAKSVDVHFRWMRDYGIDGVFLQRFMVTVTNNVLGRADCDKVLQNVRTSAADYGRVYGLMYDLSGMKNGCAPVVMADWKALVDRMHLTKDDRYIHHRGKPVVALWGFAIAGKRDALIEDGMKLIDFFHNDPVYGGITVMIGVGADWRTLDTPAIPSPQLQALAKAADIVSPWAVGTESTLADVAGNAERRWKPDEQWCRQNGVAYMPVVFPGFSWHNLKGGPPDQIPRRGGAFLWSQYMAAKATGATMVYQAMFDEVDEGTAIFKVTNAPPGGEGKSQFLTYEGLPADFYLKLVGEGTRLIHGEMTPGEETLVKNAR
jgi:hypothetical protein